MKMSEKEICAEKEILWGRSIGKKFYPDGRVRRYPGNTVVADVTAESPAFAVMANLRKLLVESPLADYYIPMPEDSYHMTVIRGLNDQVRTDAYWPSCLPKDLPMEKVDDHVSAAIARAGIPDGVQMILKNIKFGSVCVLAELAPANEEAKKILLDFRDRAADEIRHRLPKHENYVFHITLAYTRIQPSTEKELREKEILISKMNDLIGDGVEFTTSKPYMAYFDDMLYFSPTRLPR